jgi:hypothetical protein
MSTGIITVNPGLLAFIQGANNSMLAFSREILLLECEVAGTSYQNLTEIEPDLKVGDRFLLFREANNEYDKFAVAILNSTSNKLGYIPKSKNETIARLLDAGKTVYGTLEKKAWKDKWLKMEVKVHLVDM